MLLIRELVRVIRDLMGFSWATRRVGILLVVVAVVVILAITASVATVGPIVVYPLL